MIWLAVIVIGLGVTLALWAMCRIGAQADELTARIRQRQSK